MCALLNCSLENKTENIKIRARLLIVSCYYSLFFSPVISNQFSSALFMLHLSFHLYLSSLLCMLAPSLHIAARCRYCLCFAFLALVALVSRFFAHVSLISPFLLQLLIICNSTDGYNRSQSARVLVLALRKQ